MSTSLDKLRQKLNKKKEEASSVKGNENELTTSGMQTGAEGKIKIRLLPMPEEEAQYFYVTHSYNYLEGVGENGADKMLFSKKILRDKKGEDHKNPIDKLVKEIYKSEEESLKQVASKSKRKRRFYFHCLLLKKGEAPQYKIFIDATNRGEVTKQLCEMMALPFCKDTEDAWFDPDSVPSDDPIDLLDTKEGFDISITKVKTGQNKWDVEYKVVADRNPRALTKEEKDLLKERVDLNAYVEYVESFEEVNEWLNRLLKDESAPQTTSAPKKVVKTASKKIEDEVEDEELDAALTDTKESEEDGDDEEEEEVMSLLEDEEEEEEEEEIEKPKAKKKKKK